MSDVRRNTVKRRWLVAIICVLLLLITGFFTSVVLLSLWNHSTNHGILKYQGAEMYMSSSYLRNENFSEKMLRAAADADEFFPSPEEVADENCTVDFYVFDGESSYTKKAYSLVLDRTYEAEDNYIVAKRIAQEIYPNYVNEAYPYDFLNFKRGNYSCYITEKAQRYPFAFGVVCFCDESQTIRLLYFCEAREITGSAPHYIQDCTACPWD